jgi:hypothetical protein
MMTAGLPVIYSSIRNRSHSIGRRLVLNSLEQLEREAQRHAVNSKP